MGRAVDILKHLRRSNMFPHTVKVRKRTGSSSYKGAESLAASQSYRARVVGKRVLVKDANGKDVVSKMHAVFDGDYGFGLLDEFTLPSHFIPSVVKPIDIQEAPDESTDGKHHQTVFF